MNRDHLPKPSRPSCGNPIPIPQPSRVAALSGGGGAGEEAVTLAGILSSAAFAIEHDHPAIATMLKDAAIDAQKMEIFCNERVAEAQEESMIARDAARQESLREAGVIPFPFSRTRQSRGWDAVGSEVVELRK